MGTPAGRLRQAYSQWKPAAVVPGFLHAWDMDCLLLSPIAAAASAAHG